MRTKSSVLVLLGCSDKVPRVDSVGRGSTLANVYHFVDGNDDTGVILYKTFEVEWGRLGLIQHEG